MSESERSESYGTPMSSDDAAELEELRREAAVLREQLENAVGPQSGLRSARDVHQLEARIDSLAARNSKLMETLKEARQQLLALREEVDRLGQPPSGYGVLLGTHDDDTVDVFTSGRKMRLTCSPNIDAEVTEAGPDRAPQRGADRRRGRQLRVGRRNLHPARNPRRRAPRARGRSRRRRAHRLAGRAVGRHRGPARRLRRRGRRRPAAAQAASRRLAARRHQGRLRVRAHPEGRGRGPGAGRGARRQLQRHRRPGPSDRADPRRRRVAVPAQGALPGVLAAAAQGRAALRPARMRQDADRQGGGQLAGQEDGRGAWRRRPRGEVLLPQHQGPRAAEQVRRRDRTAHPADLPAGPGEGVRGHPGDRVLRRDGLDLPHPRHRRELGCRDHRRPAAALARSTASRAWRTSS